MPGPLDLGLQGEDPVDVDVVPAAVRLVADGPPEVAVGERGTAAAALVVTDVALPQVDDLTERTRAGKLTQNPFQQGGTAAAQAADEEYAYH